MNLGTAIMLSVFIMAIMVIIGRKVQTATKFVYPKDIFSIAFIAAIIACIPLTYYELIPVSFAEVYWCAPALLGYIIGYVLGNEQSYQMLEYISPYARYTAILPVVIYEEDEKTYIADQTNKELLKRLLFHINHELDSGGVKLEFDWNVDAKFKLKKYERKACNIEALETKFERTFGKLKFKKYKTTVKVAVANQVSHAQLVAQVNALDTLNDNVLSLSNEVVRLKNTVPKRVAMSIIDLTRPSYEKTTIENITKYLDKVKEKPEQKEASA